MKHLTQKTAVIFLAILLSLTSTLVEAQKTWSGGAAGNWSVGANWTPAGVPAVTDAVTIQGGSNVTVDNASATCLSIQLGGTGAGSGNGTLTFASGSVLLVADVVTIGSTSTGTSGSGSLDFTAGGLLQLGGAGAALNEKKLGTFIPGTGTIEYFRVASGQTVAPTSGSGTLGAYNNLILSGGATKTMTNVTTVNGTLTLSGAVSASSTGMSIGGDLIIGSGTT